VALGAFWNVFSAFSTEIDTHAAGNLIPRSVESIRGQHDQPAGTAFCSMRSTKSLQVDVDFPLHMFLLRSDRTMQQSNPGAGGPNTSDSNAMGIWVPDGGKIKGKLVEGER